MSTDQSASHKSKKDKKFHEYTVNDLLEDSDDDEDDEEFLELYKSKGLNNAQKNAAATNQNGSKSVAPVISSQQQNIIGSSALAASLANHGSADSILQPQNLIRPPQQQITAPNATKQNVLKHHNLSDSDDSDDDLLLQAAAKQQKASHHMMDDDDDDEEDDDINDFINKIKSGGASATTPSSSSSKPNQKPQPNNRNEPKKQLTSQTTAENDYEALLRASVSVQQDILEVIEKNEKMNEVGPDKIIDQANHLLSFDKKFYQVKKKLFDYNEFNEISRKLYQVRDHQFKGVVSALSIVQDYLFVGNSMGIIRAFDVKSQKEMKPLMDEAGLGQNNKVTCMDITSDGGYLLSGYKGGQIALWDLVEYKLIKVVNELHQSDVVNAKVYYMDDNQTLHAVSAEDQGRVQLIKFTKNSFLNRYSTEAQFLFKQRLKGTTAISIQKRNELYPHKFCDSTVLVAFGALHEIVVCQMRPTIKELYQVKKPNFCKEKSIPYIDWGYGLTPSQREKTVPIFAFAWDRLIQLFYINAETQTIELDGFYYSDSEINSLYFIGESILFVLVNGCEVKVLYTTKFYPGYFSVLSDAKQGDLINNKFQTISEVTAHSELEKGFEVAEIKTSLLQVQQVMNFTQSVKKYRNQIYFMGTKAIIRGKVFTWREYLDHIKFKENADWSTVLKTALEIYNGEIKGFSRVPDEKEIREGLLGSFMKDMIKESVQQAIQKFNGSTNKAIEEHKTTSTLQWDLIAIKSAIEFCLAINSTQLLFSEIFQLFSQSGLETKFLANLEPFILSGSFRKQTIPEFIVKKIIKFYEHGERQNMKVLEKVIMQLDLSDYSQREELMVTCQVNCLIGALLYLMHSQHEESPGCMQILNTLLTLVRKSQNRDTDKDDIYMVLKVDSVRKYEIEKSRLYIGFKLLWIIKMFLEGRSFPSGVLPMEKYRQHVYDIVNVITNDQYLDEMLDFDSEHFFKVITKVFMGQPLKFLVTQKDYCERNNIKCALCLSPALIINHVLADKVSGKEQRQLDFYRFLIAVQAQQANPDTPRLEINSELIQAAIFSVIKYQITSNGSNQIEEEQLIRAIESKKLDREAIEKLAGDKDIQQASQMVNLRVYLLEKKMDYLNSFKLNMQHPNLKKKIFQWIDKTLEHLSKSPEYHSILDNLRSEIQLKVKDLIQQDISACVVMIDQWFEDSYQEQLIIEELAAYPEVQYNYIRKFITQNEAKIEKTIEESIIQAEKAVEAKRYKGYLVLHTRLLCMFDREGVHEQVKKDFYPIEECLAVCKEEKVELAVAVLHKRNGDYMLSLNSYLNIIDNLDPTLLMKELTNIQKSQPIPLPTHQKLVEISFLKNEQFTTIQYFDTNLQEALSLAEKQNAILGEASWFRILEFLTQYITRVGERLMKNVKKQSIDDTMKIERVKDFVDQRKTMILRNLPETISLQRLTEQLELDFKEINTIYENKVHDYRENQKYLRLAKKLQEKELAVIQREFFKEVKLGKQMTENNLCSSCNMPTGTLIGKQVVILFLCGHAYHQNCLPKDKDFECQLCTKKQLELMSKQEQKNKRQQQSTSMLQKEEAEANKQVKRAKDLAEEFQKTVAGNTSQQKDEAAASQVLAQRRLEVFDAQLVTLGLQRSSFY